MYKTVISLPSFEVTGAFACSLCCYHHLLAINKVNKLLQISFFAIDIPQSFTNSNSDSSDENKACFRL